MTRAVAGPPIAAMAEATAAAGARATAFDAAACHGDVRDDRP